MVFLVLLVRLVLYSIYGLLRYDFPLCLFVCLSVFPCICSDECKFGVVSSCGASRFFLSLAPDSEICCPGEYKWVSELGFVFEFWALGKKTAHFACSREEERVENLMLGWLLNSRAHSKKNR